MSDYYSTKRSREPADAGASTGHIATDPAVGADHLAYIADMIAELQDIARRGRFDTLATILGLAEVEASRQAAECRSPPGR